MSKKNQTKGRSDGLVAENRRSRRDYAVEDTLEAEVRIAATGKLADFCRTIGT